MRKTSRYRALHLEGKCRASPGLTKGGCHKSPFVPPTSADNGTERNYLFSKRLSGRPSQAGLFPCGWEWGVGCGGGLLFSPRSWRASWRRQQHRSQALTARLGAGGGRPRGRMTAVATSYR